MASIVASLPPPLLLHGRKTLFTTLRKVPVSSIRGFSHIAERQTRVTVIVKATGEGSESSTSLSIVKSFQNVWDKSEDRFALIGLGFAAIVAFWASINVITAIDKLPLIPGVLEFIGILFSSVRTQYVFDIFLKNGGREENLKSRIHHISPINFGLYIAISYSSPIEKSFLKLSTSQYQTSWVSELYCQITNNFNGGVRV